MTNQHASSIATHTVILGSVWPLASASVTWVGVAHFVNGPIAPMIALGMGCASQSMMASKALTFPIAIVQSDGREMCVSRQYAKGIVQIGESVWIQGCVIAMKGGRELCVRFQNVPIAAPCMGTVSFGRTQMKLCATAILVG